MREFGVASAIAVPLDRNDFRVVREAVDERDGAGRVGEDGVSLLEGQIRRDEYPSISGASMRPSLFSDGNLVGRTRTDGRVGASMRPSLFSDTAKADLKVRLYDRSLQAPRAWRRATDLRSTPRRDPEIERSDSLGRRSRAAAKAARRDFVTRDPCRSNQQCRCMPRWLSLELGTSRGGSLARRSA